MTTEFLDYGFTIKLKYNLSEIKLFFKNMGTKELAGSQPRCFDVLGLWALGGWLLLDSVSRCCFGPGGRVCVVVVVAFVSE